MDTYGKNITYIAEVEIEEEVEVEVEVVDLKQVQRTVNHGMEWHFNPPAGLWWGGVFERLIRSTKRCLKKILPKAKLTCEELLTVLREIEIVINNLLLGRRLNLRINEPEGTGSEKLSLTLMYMKTLQDNFWTKWKREYLTELREHHRSK